MFNSKQNPSINENNFNLVTDNNHSGIRLDRLDNSRLEEISPEEAGNVVGGMFLLVNRELIKTDVQLQPQPLLVENVVFQPNEQDRLRLCAIDPTFC